MAGVFWNAHGVIFIHYLQKGRAITGAYYAALLNRLVDEIRKKRQNLEMSRILFHDDNTPSHQSNIAQAKKHEMKWETEGYFGGFGKSYYLKGIEKLKDRRTRCNELEGK